MPNPFWIDRPELAEIAKIAKRRHVIEAEILKPSAIMSGVIGKSRKLRRPG
jgi:hypothetical protein